MSGFDIFESEWLDRRVEFLLSRADAHLRKDDIRSIACAATLLQDAAAIGFMRDDTESGRAHLDIAGEHFLRLGLPRGVLLMMLASEGERGGDALAPMLKAATAALDMPSSARREMGPLFASALHQPEQLMALEASAALADAAGASISRAEERMRGVLHPYRSHPVGPTGIALGAFIRLMDFGQGSEFENLEAFGNPRLDMMSVLARRGRQLASASEDRHHWRLLLSPAALLDFDLVALFAIWWAHGRSPRDMMPELGSELPPMMMLPVQVAQTLRPRRRSRGEG